MTKMAAIHPDDYPSGQHRSWPALAAIAIVLVIAAVIVAKLFVFGATSDEAAIRNWLQTPAGGGASSRDAAAVHVSGCVYTAAKYESRVVVKCAVTTDAPNPSFNTCFVISQGKVLRGGWQLRQLDSCDGLRFDAKTETLVDLISGTHYRLRPQ